MRRWLSTADLGRMFVELTETVWPSDEHALLAAVDAVRAAGGRIAADDVGAGYSGLLHLVRLRPEMIKVDRQLVRMVGTDPGSSVVIRMLGDVAGQLDAWVLAEGVEDAVQLGLIAEMGVPLLQGFYLAAPAAPWPPADNLDRVWSLALGIALPEHLVAHQRDPAPGELVTDVHGRPELIRIHRPGEPAILVRPLTMAPSTPVCEAIVRALARPDPVARVAPIVVTDEAGRPVGCVDLLPLVRQAMSDPGR
jgi:hypothetical protein